MFKDKKVVVVMPAYNAAETLEKTYNEVMDQLSPQYSEKLGIHLRIHFNDSPSNAHLAVHLFRSCPTKWYITGSAKLRGLPATTGCARVEGG